MKDKSNNFLKYDILIPGFVAAGLLVGGILYSFHYENWDHKVWLATLVIGSLPFILRTFKAIFRGKFGVDLIAIVAIFASFWAGQYLAGVIILLMLSGGEALEAFAQARAKKELTLLVGRAPSIAHIKQ